MDDAYAPQKAGSVKRNGKGQRGEDLRRQNMSAVLRHILANPKLSRSEIAAQLGMSAASVTSLSAELLDLNLVQAGVPDTAAQGRPRVPLAIDANSCLVLGIHLGPRTTGIVLMGLDGTEHRAVLVPHKGVTPERVVNKVVERARRLMDELPRSISILGTGIATGGSVDRLAGTIIENPSAGWHDVPVRDLIGDRLPSPIIVDQNARTAAQSELLYGHGRSTNDFVLMVVTSDVGAVTVHDGVIQAGSRQDAGQIAHLPVSCDRQPCTCGRSGCLKAVASDDALVQDGLAEGLDIVSPDDMALLAGRGSEVAFRLMARRTRYVARAAAMLIDIVDPALLVVAGTPAEMPQYLELMRQEVAARARAGQDAANRVVLAPATTFSLSLFAATPIVEAVLSDPVRHMYSTVYRTG